LHDAHADPCKNRDACHRILLRQPGEHHRRQQHDVELDDSRSDERHRNAGRFFIDLRNRLDDVEPDGDHDLHADGDEYHRLDYSDGDRDCNGAEPAHDQLVHGEPHEHYPGRRQHAELDDGWRDEHYDHAGNVRVELRERVDRCEP